MTDAARFYIFSVITGPARKRRDPVIQLQKLALRGEQAGLPGQARQ